jgi:hypothetical protein
MFEEVLSSGRNRDAKSSRAVSFPVAVGLHLVAFGAVVGASMWATEEPFRAHTTSCGWPGPVPIVFHPVAVPAGPSGPPRSTAGHVKPHGVARQAPLVPLQLPVELAPTDPEADGPGDAELTEEKRSRTVRLARVDRAAFRAGSARAKNLSSTSRARRAAATSDAPSSFVGSSRFTTRRRGGGVSRGSSFSKQSSTPPAKSRRSAWSSRQTRYSTRRQRKRSAGGNTVRRR